MTDAEHRRIVQGLEQAHRVEIGKLGMKIAVLAAALEDGGLAVPDPDAVELLRMWRTAAGVVSTASEFVAELGTAKELIFPMGKVAA